MLPLALHGYCISVFTSTRETLFFLIYRMDVVLPVEVEIPSMRVLMETKLKEAKWFELDFIEEKKLTALCHGQLYQRRMKKAFDDKEHPHEF